MMSQVKKPPISFACRFCQAKSYSPTHLENTFYNQKTFQYLKCRHCGLVQVYPLPSPDDLEKMYPVDYQGTLSDWEFERQQPLLSIIDKKNYASILDDGCGNGALVKILLERKKKVEGVPQFLSSAAVSSVFS